MVRSLPPLFSACRSSPRFYAGHDFCSERSGKYALSSILAQHEAVEFVFQGTDPYGPAGVETGGLRTLGEMGQQTADRRLDLDYGARLYRLVPVGSRRDQVEWAADQLLEAIDVGPSPRR